MDNQVGTQRESARDAVMNNLHVAKAMMEAIELGELFAARPECPSERARHCVGLSLLQVAQERIVISIQALDPS